MKKILAAIAASAMVVSMLAVSAMAEGLDGEGDTLDEDPAEVSDIIDEGEPEPEPAPVENPKTGNSPVAMAVIPVALAAAAVIAKKSK